MPRFPSAIAWAFISVSIYGSILGISASARVASNGLPIRNGNITTSSNGVIAWARDLGPQLPNNVSHVLAIQSGVAVADREGLIFLNHAGVRVWRQANAMAPLAAVGDSLYAASPGYVERIDSANGTILWRRGSCQNNFAWIIASRHSVVAACGDPISGNANLLAFSSSGARLGRSTFFGGAVTSPQILWANDDYAVVSGVSSGGATVIRAALVSLADATVRRIFDNSQIAGVSQDSLLLASAASSNSARYGITISKINFNTGASRQFTMYFEKELAADSPFDATAVAGNGALLFVAGRSVYLARSTRWQPKPYLVISDLTSAPTAGNGLMFVEHRYHNLQTAEVIDLSRSLIESLGQISNLGAFYMYGAHGAIVVWQRGSVTELLDMSARTVTVFPKLCLPQGVSRSQLAYLVLCSDPRTSHAILLDIRR